MKQLLLTAVLVTAVHEIAIAGWEVEFDGSSSRPVIHDETIFIGSSSGSVFAFDATTGRTKWSFKTGKELSSGPKIIQAESDSFEDTLAAARRIDPNEGRSEVPATPVVRNGVVYIGSRDKRFYAFDTLSGERIWSTDIGHQVFREAIVTAGHIVVHGIIKGGNANAVFVLEPSNGTVKWSTQGKGNAAYPAATDNAVLYSIKPQKAGLSDKQGLDNTLRFESADLDTGEIIWSISLTGRHSAPVATSGDTAFLMVASHLYAADIESGELLWDVDTGDRVQHGQSPPLTVHDHSILFATSAGVYSIAQQTGEIEWFIEGNYAARNMRADSLVYFRGDTLSNNNRFYAADLVTGDIVWTYRSKHAYHTEVVADMVYVSVDKGMVALDAATGKRRWRFKQGKVSAAPVIYRENVIFPTQTQFIWGQGPNPGHLYSLDARTGK